MALSRNLPVGETVSDVGIDGIFQRQGLSWLDQIDQIPLDPGPFLEGVQEFVAVSALLVSSSSD